MLRITVIPTGTAELTFSTFERYGIPAPPNGVDAEVNDDLTLQFEDEDEAVTYAGQLENLSNELNDKSSPQNLAIGDIIMAINNDEFVENYTREN